MSERREGWSGRQEERCGSIGSNLYLLRYRDEHSELYKPPKRTSVRGLYRHVGVTERRAESRSVRKSNYHKLHEQVDVCIEEWDPDRRGVESDHQTGQSYLVEIHFFDVLLNRHTGVIETIGVKANFDEALVNDTENYTVLVLDVRCVPKHVNTDNELVLDYESPWPSDKKIRLLVCSDDGDEGPTYSEFIPEELLCDEALSNIQYPIHKMNGYIL